MDNRADIKVSVIVLTYNQADTVRRALDSVLAQKCGFAFEIVVGDDDSSDGTRAICEEYARRYSGVVRLMPKAPNKGIVDNYFDCLEACRGTYVTDCAGDDYWVGISRLQLQCDALEKNKSAVAVGADWEIENVRSGSVVRSSDIPQHKQWCRYVAGPEMLRGVLGCKGHFPVLLSAVLYRRDVLMTACSESPGMVRNRRWGCEDLPVMAALAAAGDIAHVSAVVMRYVVSDNTVSNYRDKRKLFDFYAGAFEARAILARHYGVALSELRPAFEDMIHYLTALAFDLHDDDRRRRVCELAALWGMRVPVLTSVYRWLMRNDLMWRAGIAVRRFLKD